MLRHAVPLRILLTLSQINNVFAAPLAATSAEEWEYYYDCDSDPITSISSSKTAFQATSTVLEASDGQVYVPYTTFASTVPYTANGVTSYSTTFVTGYSSSSTPSVEATIAYTPNVVTSPLTTLTGSVTPVLSTKLADTSSYTRLLSSGLTSLTSSAIQTAPKTVTAQTSGVRRTLSNPPQFDPSNHSGFAHLPPVTMGILLPSGFRDRGIGAFYYICFGAARLAHFSLGSHSVSPC